MVLQINTTLRTLNISNCDLSDYGVESLAIALAFNRSLQELDISSNKISGNGLAYIAIALLINNSLQTLNISLSRILLSERALSAHYYYRYTLRSSLMYCLDVQMDTIVSGFQ